MDTSRDIIPFENPEFGRLRVISEDGETWFVATDVAKALDYRMASDMTRRLDDDEKGTRSVRTPGGMQELSVISFPGLLNAVLGSKAKGAKEYKRWVTHEVLPSVHRTGAYRVPTSDGIDLRSTYDALRLTHHALSVATEEMERLHDRNAELERENAELAPKASMAEGFMSAEGAYTVTVAACLLRQVDGTMSRRRLFESLRADGMVEKRTNRATAKAVERGYLLNVAPSYTDPDGVRKVRYPYALVTPKGLGWCSAHYCSPVRQMSLKLFEGVA